MCRPALSQTSSSARLPCASAFWQLHSRNSTLPEILYHLPETRCAPHSTVRTPQPRSARLASDASHDCLGGFASPTKITMPSPPGFPVLGGKSSVKSGFQLFTTHTLPAWSIEQPVERISGL